MNRWKHFAAAALIGDGVMALIRPKRADAAWEAGLGWWQEMMEYFRDRPGLTRALAAVEVAGGVWWALAQERPASE